MFNWVIIMKNNTTFKIIILVIGILGYLFIGVKNMSPKVTVTFISCWTIFILAALFVLSPEIKELVFKKDRLELKRYKQKVDKALVEYGEFKNTIYPLLEVVMTSIIFNGYLSVSSRPANLVDFLKRIENLPLDIDADPQMQKLITAVKVKTIDAYAAELISIRQSNNLDTNIDNCISVKYPRFDDKHYLNVDDVIVDFEKLKESGEDFSDDFEKRRYLNVIKQMKEFYTQNNF